MSAISTYTEPQHILIKALREGRRAWLAKDPIDKCDHFFNFCVTAHSMRDWCIKYLKITDTSAFHTEMNLNPHFGICRDIANSSKHFGLDRTKSTVKAATSTLSKFAVLGATDATPALVEQEDISISLSDGNKLELFGFLHYVADGWINVLQQKSIPMNSDYSTIYMFIEHTSVS